MGNSRNIDPKLKQFKWTPKRDKVASLLALGHTRREIAKEANVSTVTIQSWLKNPQFSQEVNRLSVMSGVALKAERLQIVNRVVRERVKEHGIVITKKDLLEWLKFAQSETDGVKLDLTGLINDLSPTEPESG